MGQKTFLLTPCSGRTFCYRSPITDQLLCQLITDHRSPPITDHRSIVVSIDHRSSITSDHRSSITDQSSDSTHHAVGSVAVSSITDHRSPMKHKSTHFMYQTAVESSITDHRSQTAQPVPNSCIDHRSSITDET